MDFLRRRLFARAGRFNASAPARASTLHDATESQGDLP
jgi:hypothetical protein